ncbi:MAG: VOC family protein [Lapillicoccus sp.]
MKAQLEKPVLDCPDPAALASFYAAALGMSVLENQPDWVVIGRHPGMREIAFQLADPWTAPRWPDPDHPQHMHLDIRVDDVDTAEQGYRVFLDPVGHPFCLVFGPSLIPDPRMDFDITIR